MCHRVHTSMRLKSAFSSALTPRARAAFQGEVDPGKCDEYLSQLLDSGDDYAATVFDCTNKLLFRGDDFRLWSVSMYYIIVTLTTCASSLDLRTCSCAVWRHLSYLATSSRACEAL